jgi:hypothetical protein
MAYDPCPQCHTTKFDYISGLSEYQNHCEGILSVFNQAKSWVQKHIVFQIYLDSRSFSLIDPEWKESK